MINRKHVYIAFELRDKIINHQGEYSSPYIINKMSLIDYLMQKNNNLNDI